MCIETGNVSQASGSVESPIGAEKMDLVVDSVPKEASSFSEKADSDIMMEKSKIDRVGGPCLHSSWNLEADHGTLLDAKNERDIGPETPLADRKGDKISSSSDWTEEEDLIPGCQTPTGSIFDPFAPGPEELVCAPKKKLLKESRIPLRRQLNFDSCNEAEDDAEEKSLLEAVYRSFLDMIVMSQFKETSDENLLVDPYPSEGLRTPTSLPLLSQIAETCPPAPMRPTVKSRRLNQDICRKLEF